MDEREEEDWSDVSSIFGGGSDIFSNKNILKVGYVPDIEDIVGREEQINEVGRVVSPAIMGDAPDTTFIYGKTGSGKSLVSRAVLREAKKEAANKGTNFEYVYVDCSDYTTETKASRQIARELKSAVDDDEIKIPRSGLSASDYRDMTWELINEYDIEVFIIVLDEIDILDSESLIRSLSRAQESGKTDGFVSMIGISNKINYREKLDPRTDSSLRDHEIVFPPYDANMLQEILHSRKIAFKEGALDMAVIAKISALSARDHGDARKAVDMLYEAGSLAEKEGASKVNEDHVDRANEEAEINRVIKLISNLPAQAQIILQTLCILTLSNEEDGVKQFRTSKIYDFYCRLCEKEGTDPLTHNRTRELLKEMAFLEITEYQGATSEGYREGVAGYHRVVVDPELMLKGLQRSE